MTAAIIDSSEESLALAAEALREGRLVAIPTETVYGLGANALNAEACANVYKVKGRPPTDPLICHVTSLEDAAVLWADDLTTEEQAVAKSLAKAFWPGPLTIVCRAAKNVPTVVTGGSGFVGVRVPNHPVAQRLISLAGVPVAAPSANTFGHVSPTTAQHVFDDLASRDPTLLIVDGGNCSVGIESTVVKVLSATAVEVLRRGRISVAQLKEAMGKTGVEVTVRDTRSKFKVTTEAMDGPGQLLTHYSPSVPTYLVTPVEIEQITAAGSDTFISSSVHSDMVASGVTASSVHIPIDEKGRSDQKVVVLDFGSLLKSVAIKLGSRAVYRSISATSDVEEACRNVFDALRWTESVAGASVVLAPFMSEFTAGAQFKDGDAELLFAVEDRLFRAASGRVVPLVTIPHAAMDAGV